MNENDKIKLKGMITEISNSLTRIASERELIKEICARGKEELEIEPKIIRKIGKIYYDQSLQDLVQDTDDLVETYESVFGANENT